MSNQILAQTERARVVLENVPRVGFFRGGPRPPEDDPFPACLRAFLEYRGEDLGYRAKTGKVDPWHDVHIYAMGNSGAAFRLSWDTRSWNMGADDILMMARDSLAGLRRACESIGYACDILLRRDFAASLGIQQMNDYDEDDFRHRAIASIRDAGRPVIAFGVIGPPECCLITGYDDNGDVLVGWNFFQNEEVFNTGVEFDPAGYFRKRGWYADTRGLLIIGESAPRPAPHEIHRMALAAALDIMRTPFAHGLAQGQAAFKLWADTLLKHELFSPDNPELLRTQYEVHHGKAGTLAEARAWGACFLRDMAEDEPQAADELLAAAKCFDAEHDLVWAMWEFTNGYISSAEGARKFAAPGTRGRIVPLIRLAGKEDAEAAQHLQNALQLIDARQGESSTGGNRRKAERVVLEDVPKISFDKHLTPFPGALYSIMQYLGDPVEYDYLNGVTGAAFRWVWNRDDGGNIDLMNFAPEPYKRAAIALGYELDMVARDRDKMLSAIRENIKRGRPLISFGFVGPPEAGIITGFDQDGDVVIGYSYFQEDPGTTAVEKEPSGYYRLPNWFNPKDPWSSVMTIGDKNRWPGPSKRDILVSSLKWVVDLARTAKRRTIPDHICGLAGCEAWASALEVDSDYPKADAQVMGWRAMIHGDQCMMLAERRSAAGFLRMMANTAPEAVDILKNAADLYTSAADVCGKLWPWPDMGESPRRALADPQTRRELAIHVRTAADLMARATALLEQALDVLDKST